MTDTTEKAKKEKEQEKKEPWYKEEFFPISASAGATVTSSVVCSYLPLGTKGTLIGLAGGSIVSGIASALYKRWLTTAHKRLKDKGFRKPAEADIWDKYYRPKAAVKRFDIPWRSAAIIGGASLVLTAGGISVAEAFAGKPLSSVVTGSAGHGTTWSGSSQQQQQAPPVTPVYTPSPSPSPVVTPSWSPTPSPSPSGYSPSPSPSPAVTATPSPADTDTPSPTPTDEGQ